MRLTVTAAAAVLLTSLSLNAVISGGGWIAASIGAVATVALAGALTRATGPRAMAATTFLVLLAVTPLLAGPAWLARAGGIVIVLLAVASATGARLLRGFATIATYLASLLIYLCVAFASSTCYARVIPSHQALTMLGHLYSLALGEFKYAPPVPDIMAVSFVTGAGIGLVAITVDLLAVRLRRPALAGLPLLLLFSVPVATNLKQIAIGQSITFALSLAGYLALLSADGRDRLRMWGRLVTFRHVQTADESGTGPDTRELSASGRRIGLAALCLAVIMPALVPPGRVHDLFSTTVTSGSGHGSTSVALQPLLQVQQELAQSKPSPVLSYTTNDPTPTDQYFQVYVLNYNASRNDWLPSSQAADWRSLVGTQLPWQPPGVVKRTPVATTRTTITMSKDQAGPAVLPLPYAPEQLTVPDGPWLEAQNSLMVSSSRVPLAGLHYSVISKEPQPTDGQIRTQLGVPNSVETAYTSYSGPDASQLAQIAALHTVGAGTALQDALDLQSWFRSGAFTYSLKTNLPSSSHWLMKFLTTDKRGVCRQFAWAFAVLARLFGIPSRIAVGYTAGTSSGRSGTWQVTTADAHAWPELYFAGYGWLRFEPTPTAHGQGTATVPSYAIAAGGGGSSSKPGGSGNLSNGTGPQPGSHNRLQNNRNPHLAGGSPAAVQSARRSGRAIAVGIAVLVFLLLAWPALTRLVTRRRRWLTASGDAGLANAAWRELVDDMADLGVPCSPSESPRAVARRIAGEGSLDAAAVQAVTRLGAAEERARYAQGPQPGAGLAGDVRTVRRAVAASASRRQRLRAALVPASTLTAAVRVMQRGGEMLSWIESSWPSMRRQLRTVLHRTG
jgi:transglutaminase-like putative cysteine protease